MQVFVWGETTLQNYNTPMETEVQSLDDAFCVYGNGAMYRAVHIGKLWKHNMYMLNNEYIFFLQFYNCKYRYSLECMGR